MDAYLNIYYKILLLYFWAENSIFFLCNNEKINTIRGFRLPMLGLMLSIYIKYRFLIKAMYEIN